MQKIEKKLGTAAKRKVREFNIVVPQTSSPLLPANFFQFIQVVFEGPAHTTGKKPEPSLNFFLNIISN